MPPVKLLRQTAADAAIPNAQSSVSIPGSGTAAAPGASDRSAAPLRVIVLPIDNASASAASSRELQGIIERRLSSRFDVVTGPALEEFLSRHRLRYTGGIDAEAARAARTELGIDGFILTTLLGIAGAFIAAFLFPRLGLGLTLGGGIVGAIITSALGAIVLLLIVNLIQRLAH